MREAAIFMNRHPRSIRNAYEKGVLNGVKSPFPPRTGPIWIELASLLELYPQDKRYSGKRLHRYPEADVLDAHADYIERQLEGQQ